MIKAIIFDCFGVMRIDVFDATYQKFGGDVVADQSFIRQTMYDSNSGKIPSSAPVFAQRLGIDTAVWQKAIKDGSTLNNELLNYVLELRKKYKIGLLTNIGNGGLERMFEPGFLDKYFDESVASGDIGFAKPEPEAYEIIADRLGVRLDECIFTDDRQDYIDGAHSVGMKAILFKSNEQFKHDLKAIL